MFFFCPCGSDRIDNSTWNCDRARIRYYTRNRESWLGGFSLSEFDLAKLVTTALIDQREEAW
jgi:hypothetical protein